MPFVTSDLRGQIRTSKRLKQIIKLIQLKTHLGNLIKFFTQCQFFVGMIGRTTHALRSRDSLLMLFTRDAHTPWKNPRLLTGGFRYPNFHFAGYPAILKTGYRISGRISGGCRIPDISMPVCCWTELLK